MLTVTYAYHCKFIFSTLVPYPPPCTGYSFCSSQLCPLSFPFCLPLFLRLFALSCGLTCVFSLHFLSFLLFFFQPLPPDSTACCMSPLLRANTALHSQTGSQPSQRDTHFSTATRTAGDVCFSVCVCAGSVLLCINVLTCFCKQKKKGSQNLRPVSGLLPLQSSPSEQKPQISAQLPFLPCFGFRGNIT